MKRSFAFLGMVACLAIAAPAMAGTTVPGHDPGKHPNRIDKDGNGFPDVGVTVNGHYTSVYAYDANGDVYWDLGDGRVRGTVGALNDLEQATLTRCDYVINYRASFDNDPFMDSGRIHNNIRCSGYDDNSKYFYQIVHETDPLYRGNSDWSVWGTWEYHTKVTSGLGNLVRPVNHVG